MKKWYVVKGLLFILIGSLGMIFINQIPFAEAETRLGVSYDQGKLSVNIEDADIEQVLNKIGQAAQVQLKIGEGLSGKIGQIQFENLPLKDALERLVGGKGYGVVLEYKDSELVSIHISKKEGKTVNLAIGRMTVFQLVDGMNHALLEQDILRFRDLSHELRKRVPKTEAEVRFLLEKVREKDKYKDEDKTSSKISRSIAAIAGHALHNVDNEEFLPIIVEYSNDNPALEHTAISLMRKLKRQRKP